MVGRLIAAGQWQPGDPDIWIVADAGYDGPRLAFLLADLPVSVLVRMRSRPGSARRAPRWQPLVLGRPPRHGGEFALSDPASRGAPDTATATDTRLYGAAMARSWNALHPRLTHRPPGRLTPAHHRSSKAPSPTYAGHGERPAVPARLTPPAWSATDGDGGGTWAFKKLATTGPGGLPGDAISDTFTWACKNP